MLKAGAIALDVLLLAALTTTAAATSTLEPPPGWIRAGDRVKVPGVIIALQGPQRSSFIVKRAPAAPLDNPAGARGYLLDVLAGIRDASRRDYRSNGRLETRMFRNGLAALVLRAREGGEERLVLSLFEAADGPHLAVLISAAPEAMLPALLGAIALEQASGEVPSAAFARSLDGQLEITLGGGLRSRALRYAERASGFVLVISGADSEVLFKKLSNAQAAKPAEEAAIVRELAAAAAGAAEASPLRPAPSAAGPVGVYSWASVAGEPGVRLAAGYLPWGYWGYQLFGRGPSADELLVGALAATKPGPAATAGLLAASPKIAIPDDPVQHPWRMAATLAVVSLAAALLLLWSRRQKIAKLPG